MRPALLSRLERFDYCSSTARQKRSSSFAMAFQRASKKCEASAYSITRPDNALPRCRETATNPRVPIPRRRSG